MNDLDLLKEYAHRGSEEAFGTVVNRHLNLVYSTAMRELKSPELAQEVAQSVFLSLAKNAKTLKPDTVLAAWLYRVTRHAAIDSMRAETRRRVREQTAVELGHMKAESAEWRQLEPLLDQGLEALEEKDRSAILLRYFENKCLREVGAALGASEDAAQKRVTRAVEQLRVFFSRRAAIGTASVAALLSAQGAQAIPAGLSAAITSGVGLAGAAAGQGITVGLSKAIVITTAQKIVITTAFVAVIGGGLYEATQASRLRREVHKFQQQTPVAMEVERISRELTEASNQIARLRMENDRLNRNAVELVKLRAEQARLKLDSQELARRKAAQEPDLNDPEYLTAQQWITRADTLKQWIEAHPEQRIPEFDYLTYASWLDVVKDTNLVGDHAPLNAAYSLRQRAKEEFASEMSEALRRHLAANGGQLPGELSQLNRYLTKPMSDELMAAYNLVQPGNMAPRSKDEWLVSEIRQQEDAGHTHFVIGTNGWQTIQ